MSKKKLSLKEQERIISFCKENNIPLAKALKDRNLSYDNLLYTTYDVSSSDFNEFEDISTVQTYDDGIPAVSFFAGAGGLDIGFSYAGFNTLASVELIELFCNTLRRNDPNKIVIGPPNFSGDISNHEEISNALRNVVGIERGFHGVFHGGPPCQPFSIAANQRFNKSGENFKRKGFNDSEKGNLLFDYLWYIEEFLPDGFLIENVEGLIELDEGGRIKSALDHIKELGYSISEPTVINAAYYGVPQNRKRCIIMGARGEIAPVIPPANPLVTACGSVFEKPLGDVQNHITREHSAESIERYMKLPFGARDKLGRIDRLDPTKPSKTVIAGGTKGGGRSHLHPYHPRTLSVRECARLQTFPDNYVFTGSVARQFTQVGNAVPPLLAYKLALALKESLYLNGRNRI